MLASAVVLVCASPAPAAPVAISNYELELTPPSGYGGWSHLHRDGDRRRPSPGTRQRLLTDDSQLPPGQALEAPALLGGLPERKRTFLAANVAGYSYDEIAAQLDVSWLTINRPLVRARSAVRAARDGLVTATRPDRALVTANGPGTPAFSI